MTPGNLPTGTEDQLSNFVVRLTFPFTRLYPLPKSTVKKEEIESEFAKFFKNNKRSIS
ncbi:hypothetical protein LEP1GSC050_4057 [Leptospira broomii serovar Hurstbridge str. 5399]|uniref:Uncharacterized protein n=1 Tax=Leptospira broomii serovar Hurstbridge str. 5399 TaxID=1049789 RepID=T0GIL2_9LEPT|nr:hypothetical protein LEP1GSC050_4057 [Leptospira broomii serovar Hurstbridge str. 5399]